MVLSIQTLFQGFATSSYLQKAFGSRYLATRLRLLPALFGSKCGSQRCVSRFSRFRKVIRSESAPRSDELYYKGTREAARKYQKTWNEVPKPKESKKNIYKIVEEELPPVVRRDRTTRPKTACSLFDDAKMLMPLLNGCIGNRFKFVLAKRRAANTYNSKNKPMKKYRESNVARKNAPYPSYSECGHSRYQRLSTINANNGDMRPVTSAWNNFNENYCN